MNSPLTIAKKATPPKKNPKTYKHMEFKMLYACVYIRCVRVQI